MDKNKIEDFVIGLIEEIYELTEQVIWEYSGNIDRDLKENELSKEEYKKKLKELLS